MDIVSPAARSVMMSNIRSCNTAPEVTIRKMLFAQGFRYRLHRKDLPGKPDLVLPQFKAVIFVHGCFWHMHGRGCYLSKRPSSNIEFWDAKLRGNQERDQRVKEQLLVMEWRVCTVWECSIRGRNQDNLNQLIQYIGNWLRGKKQEFETAPILKGYK